MINGFLPRLSACLYFAGSQFLRTVGSSGNKRGQTVSEEANLGSGLVYTLCKTPFYDFAKFS